MKNLLTILILTLGISFSISAQPKQEIKKLRQKRNTVLIEISRNQMELLQMQQELISCQNRVILLLDSKHKFTQYLFLLNQHENFEFIISEQERILQILYQQVREEKRLRRVIISSIVRKVGQ